MGAAESRSNDTLVDQLVKQDIIDNRNIERAFRTVDRAHFLPNGERAYSTMPIAISSEPSGEFYPGKLHLSSVDATASVLAYLNLGKGHSFMHIGSGSGYLSTLAGILVGDTGTNHGIELYQNLVDYSNRCIDKWYDSDLASSVASTRPVIRVGDVHDANFTENHFMRYDRIYISFVVNDTSTRSRVLRMLKIGGILIAPDSDNLRYYKREALNYCTTAVLSMMNYCDSIRMDYSDKEKRTPSFEKVVSLTHMCRQTILNRIRKAAYDPRVMKAIRHTIMSAKKESGSALAMPRTVRFGVEDRYHLPGDMAELMRRDYLATQREFNMVVDMSDVLRGNLLNEEVAPRDPRIAERPPPEPRQVRPENQRPVNPLPQNDRYNFFDPADPLSMRTVLIEEAEDVPPNRDLSGDELSDSEGPDVDELMSRRTCEYLSTLDLLDEDDTSDLFDDDEIGMTPRSSTTSEGPEHPVERKKVESSAWNRERHEQECIDNRTEADEVRKAAHEKFENLIHELRLPYNLKNYLRYMQTEVYI